MPLITVKLIKDVFSPEQQQEIYYPTESPA